MIIKSLKTTNNLTSKLNVYEVTVGVNVESYLYDLTYYVKIESEISSHQKEGGTYKDYTLHFIKNIYTYITGEDQEYNTSIEICNCETFFSLVGRDVSRLS